MKNLKKKNTANIGYLIAAKRASVVYVFIFGTYWSRRLGYNSRSMGPGVGVRGTMSKK